jgi:hypothetical protein
VILGNREMKNPTNLFITNLAFADILVTKLLDILISKLSDILITKLSNILVTKLSVYFSKKCITCPVADFPLISVSLDTFVVC